MGGMREMLAEGLLDVVGTSRPEMAFAIHVTPNLPVGMVGGRSGALMAATDDFRVVVRGRGGHASQPHLANDPIPVAAEMVTALQTFVARQVNAFDPAVITVGHLTAGSTTNVIPETAVMEGTIRTVSEATRAQVRSGFVRTVEGIAAAHGCTVEVTLTQGYPVTVNDAGVQEHCVDVVRAVMGERAFLPFPSPVMGAEDVSYLFEEVPGAMVFLGVCPEDIGNSLEAPSCHSNRMRLNEAALPFGAALHAGVASSWLGAQRHARH
jgi:hippurate hydrolase